MVQSGPGISHPRRAGWTSCASPTAAGTRGSGWCRLSPEPASRCSTGHPIPPALVSETYAEWERFFASPAKHDHTFDPKRQDGYFPYRSENAKGRTQKDLKEFFHFYPDTRLPRGALRRTRELYDALGALAGELLGLIEEHTPDPVCAGLSMPLREMIDAKPADAPPDPQLPAARRRRGARGRPGRRPRGHQPDHAPGRGDRPRSSGVRHRGAWRDVPADPGSIVINAGDMLQMATDGHYRSTSHRVVNPSEGGRAGARLSMPLFLHPWPEVRLSERHTAGSYLEERLLEIGLKS